MTRIASSMISQTALMDLQKAQQGLYKASSQTASQTKATDVEGYGSQTQTLVSANRLVARIESRIQVGAELNTRLTIQDSVLERAAEVIADLKISVSEGMGLGNGGAIDMQLENAFTALKDVFNTNLGGRYLFGGTLNETPPIVSGSLDDLAANPLDDAFVQGAKPQVVKVDAVQKLEAAPLAADAARDAFDLLRRLKTFSDSANGPFEAQMTDAQKTALTSEVGAMDDVYQQMIQLQGQNGRVLNQVETAADRQNQQLASLQSSIGKITEVDLAEVAVRLNQAQLSYQASASVFNTVRGLTLLDVIR